MCLCLWLRIAVFTASVNVLCKTLNQQNNHETWNMQTSEKNVVALNITKLMLENENVDNSDGNKLNDSSGILEGILSHENGIKSRRISVISKCVDILIASYRFRGKSGKTLRRPRPPGDMPQQTEHIEQTDIHVPEPTGPREPTDRGTEHEYEFDAIDAIQANEDGYYSQRELMNYARLKRKNPIEEDFDTYMANHEVPVISPELGLGRSLQAQLELPRFQCSVVVSLCSEQMSRDDLIFHGDEFWGTLNDPEEELKMAFAEIDKDGTGTVDKEELRTFLQNNGADPLTDEELNDIFDHLDANEDGTLSLNELKELLL